MPVTAEAFGNLPKGLGMKRRKERWWSEEEVYSLVMASSRPGWLITKSPNASARRRRLQLPPFSAQHSTFLLSFPPSSPQSSLIVSLYTFNFAVRSFPCICLSRVNVSFCQTKALALVQKLHSLAFVVFRFLLFSRKCYPSSSSANFTS